MRGLVATLAVASALLIPAVAATGSGGKLHLRPGGVVTHLGATRTGTHPLPFLGPSFLTFDANYVSLINRYLTDVDADSGVLTNVYSTDPQYTDGTGAAQYASTFGNSVIARDPLPANGCDDTDLGLSDPVCLDDAQLEAEIQKVMAANGWHGSTSTMFFLMTPTGFGSCFLPGNADVSAGQACSTDAYCAYHNAFTNSQGEPVIYANEPYDATTGGGHCFAGESPNGDDADATINTISHEHNEAITDPFLDAWYSDADGSENGDLCAWIPGPTSGPPGAEYSQTINGHNYWLQEEYSNADKGCVQHFGGTPSGGPGAPHGTLLDYHAPGLVMHTNTTYAIYWLPTPGNTVGPTVTGTPAVGHVLTSSTGSWTGAPTSYAYQWQRCLPNAGGCSNIPGATASTYALTSDDYLGQGWTVRSTVSATNVNGASAYAGGNSVLVEPIPAVISNPVVSGIPAVGKTLTTTDGTWNVFPCYVACAPASLTYQWLRCPFAGTGCVAIPGATSPTYTITSSDADHRLSDHRLAAVVTATNAAGTASATSAATARIDFVPYLIRAPRITGHAIVGRWLGAYNSGSWRAPDATFTYSWLRCSAHGLKCVPIKNATKFRYHLTRRDASHRLRVRVTARNLAGRKTGTSAASQRVKFKR